MRHILTLVSLSALLGCSETPKGQMSTLDEDGAVDADGDGFNTEADCDDLEPRINPDAEEICDEIDNDCDGSIDEGLLTTFHADEDGDGYGNPQSVIESCEAANGWVENATDCDDSNPHAYPGAEESCRDESDLNCDGEITHIPLPSTCEVHLVEQNTFSSLDLTDTGLMVGSVSVNGSAVNSGSNHDLDDFLGFTEEQITTTFTNYLLNQEEFTEDIIVILDIENPIHPKGFYAYLEDPILFASIIDAFRLRINVARAVLPNNPIGLYGTVTPHGQGSDSGFSDTREGYDAAGALGLYDDLDYVVPVVYHRFGETDPSFDTLDDMTHQALQASAALRRTDGSSIPLFPLLSLTIFNGNSSHNGEAPLPESVDLIIENVLQYPEVALIGFWTGDDDSSAVGHITTFFEAVEMVPIPDCICPE